jgi:CRISPR/Cas system-associated exonuclease Cas4 (RecB family)
MRPLFVIFAVVLAIAAWMIRFIALRLAHQTGIQVLNGPSRLVSTDVGIGKPLILRDDELGLRGKPDYLLEEAGPHGPQLVPVEIKPTRRSLRLYESDRIQIAGYLMTLRGAAGDSASSVGYVKYHSNTFEVRLTPAVEATIRRLVSEVRSARLAPLLHRSHRSPARCAGCPVRHRCDEALS